MLWWAGANKPHFKVCTDELGEGIGDSCEVLGAPENVRSIQMQCKWNCSGLKPRERVEVYGKVVGKFLVATESREATAEPDKPASKTPETPPAAETAKQEPPKG